jgi:NAD(P)-dependent dehydrogenase (short-subunit alcohol dehydrogenase family)
LAAIHAYSTVDRMTRTAIVTGAARGIGQAIAKRLAQDGLAVGVLDLDNAQDTVDAIEVAGGRALAVATDVNDESAVRQAVDKIANELGAPTVLVNNAGLGPRADLVDLTTDQWDFVLGVNLRGHFFLCRAVCPHMIAAQHGRIVNISSVSATGDSGRVDYASAKAGVIGLTKSLALQLGKNGITANVIAPGFVESDMTRLSAKRLGLDFDAFKEQAAQSNPVRRVGQPEDIAHAAAFFASHEAGFVNGQVLYVAGGPVD